MTRDNAIHAHQRHIATAFKGVRLERAPPAAMLVLQCDVTNPDPVPAKRYIDPQELGTGADTRTGLSFSRIHYSTTLISHAPLRDAHFLSLVLASRPSRKALK
jgi:hypothetical protein